MHVPLGRRERHGAKDCSLDLHRYLSIPFVKSLICAVEIVGLVSLPAGITNKPWGEWVISVARARLHFHLLTDSTLSRSVFGAQWTPFAIWIARIMLGQAKRISSTPCFRYERYGIPLFLFIGPVHPKPIAEPTTSTTCTDG